MRTYVRPHYLEGSAVNLAELKRHYRRHPIVVYTGAGVSRGDEKGRFGLPGWLDLLREILRRSTALSSTDLPEDPWDAAEQVIKKCGGKERFQRELISIVQARENYADAKRQLSKSFLGEAPTLNAIAAFCAHLKGQVQKVKGDRYDIGPNRRVRAILTSNYDPFLEAAFSTKFIKPLLKPVAAYGSRVGNLNQIPVFHIHGYVPHPAQRRGASRKPLVAQLVLGRDDYETAWDRSNAFGTTMTTQIHFLRHYTMLFVGFSFADKYVCNLLEAIKEEYRSSQTPDRKQHFALVSAGLFNERGGSYFRRIGVRPILYRDHNEIPFLLGELYVSGLIKDYESDDITLAWVDRHTHKVLQQDGPSLKSQQYWSNLLDCRNGGVPASYDKPPVASSNRLSPSLSRFKG